MSKEYSVAQKIRWMRMRSKISGEELAEEIQTSQSVISHLETGRRRGSLDMLSAVATHFGVLPEVLLSPHIAPENMEKFSELLLATKNLGAEDLELLLSFAQRMSRDLHILAALGLDKGTASEEEHGALFKKEGDEESPELLTELSRRIKALRAMKGWSLQVLSDKTGLSRPFLSGLERAKRGVRLSTLEKIALAFQVRLSLLLEPSVSIESLPEMGTLLQKAGGLSREKCLAVIELVRHFKE